MKKQGTKLMKNGNLNVRWGDGFKEMQNSSTYLELSIYYLVCTQDDDDNAMQSIYIHRYTYF